MISVIVTIIVSSHEGGDQVVLKHSRQREAIKTYLMSRTDHPTADQIYAALREEFPNISLGTVYRNLSLLEELGEIQRFRSGTTDRFDGNAANHYHFICNECGCVDDIPLELQNSICELAAKAYNGTIDYHLTYFYGKCQNCIKKI